MSKPDLMVDIETLSTRNDAAVIAIGVAAFGGDFSGDIISAQFLIDPRYAPGHRSRDTLRWWEEQDPGVFAHAVSGKETPEEVCERLEDFYIAHGPKQVWANPPQFDIVILRTLYDALGRKFPIHYRQERDFRTLTALAKELKIDYQPAYEGHIKHNARSDAVCQALATQLILRRLSFFAKLGAGSVPTV